MPGRVSRRVGVRVELCQQTMPCCVLAGAVDSPIMEKAAGQESLQ
jgi:hypothetical protein